ncbi:hypothetical protein [Massilia sp. CF038]|uniref:hypothetical protein n=1 Tax=Massilia sp. CF038 TaxID=1881045 RepID=UPI000933D002|nr:hypothetical protein [Massilia sp. CF038]
MANIECKVHGSAAYALICQNLHNDAGLPYLLIEAEPGEPAQAWCETCDEALVRSRGWSDAANAIADWKLWCDPCFASNLEARELITLVAGGPAPE